MTSPAAKMCGTVVQNVSSTFSRPRSSARRPAAPRFSRSVADTRPAENSTTSLTIRLPDSSNSTPRGVGLDSTAIEATASPSRNVTLRLRIWWSSSSTISRSRNSSGRSRRSMRVTDTPSAANIEAYSTPITPAPTTASVRGSFFIVVTSSLVRTTSPSAGTPGGAAGRVPTAMTMRAALTVWVRSPTICRRCGSTNEASPWSRVMSLRCSWSLDDRPLARHHVVHPLEQLRGGGPAFGPHPPPGIQDATGPGEEDDRLAQRLAGNRAGVDAHPAHAAGLLDHRDPLAELGGLHGGPLAGRPTADTDQVVVERSVHPTLPSFDSPELGRSVTPRTAVGLRR